MRGEVIHAAIVKEGYPKVNLPKGIAIENTLRYPIGYGLQNLLPCDACTEAD